MILASGGAGGLPNNGQSPQGVAGGQIAVTSPATGLGGADGSGATETITGPGLSEAVPGGLPGFFGSGGNGGGDQTAASGQNGVGGNVIVQPET